MFFQPASKTTVVEQLEKAKANLPAKKPAAKAGPVVVKEESEPTASSSCNGGGKGAKQARPKSGVFGKKVRTYTHGNLTLIPRIRTF